MIEQLPFQPVMQECTPDQVHALVAYFTGLWQGCPVHLPEIGPVYTPPAQQENAARLDRLLEKVYAELQNPPGTAGERRVVTKRLEVAGRDLAVNALGLTEPQLAAMPLDPSLDCLIEFVRAARSFDPGLDLVQVYQAARNVWTMNFLQILLGRPVQLTPSMLGYSLIYPYSDNYLDDPHVPEAKKLVFSQRLGRRLAGEALSTGDERERRIYDLVAMIESQFDRSENPQVYASLAAIHRAQVKSLRLLRSPSDLRDDEVLKVIFEKGGTSVLADGYLVARYLSPAQQSTAFAFGVLTQLVDDLEDVTQDLQDGLMTVFSRAAQQAGLDAITNRMLHFAALILTDLPGNHHPDPYALAGLLQRSVTVLIANSIAPARRFYSPAYLRSVEARLPFRFSYLSNLRERLARQRLPLMRLLESFIQTNGLAR